MKNHKYVVTHNIFKKRLQFHILNTIFNDARTCIKKEYYPMKNSTSGHHNYNTTHNIYKNIFTFLNKYCIFASCMYID